MAFVPVENITKTLKQSSDRFHILPTFDELQRRYERLNEQRKQKIFCDVTIQCGEANYPAHSSVLGSVSPYFRALLTSPFHGGSTGPTTASLHQFSQEAIALLLDVIYADATIDIQYVPEMLRLADFLQFDWLLDRLIELIRPNLHETNCFDWLEIAQTFGIEKLVLIAESYIRIHLEELLGMAEYQDHALAIEKDGIPEREIVFYCSHNSVNVIDVEKKSFVRQETGPGRMTSLLPMLGELETMEDFRLVCCFSYKNQLHAMTSFDLRTPSSGLRESCIEIQTYQQLTEEYADNCRFQNSRILYDEFLFQEYTDCRKLSAWRATEAGFVLRQCLFDGRENVYLLFESSQLEEVLVYRLSLKTRQCSTNYIRLHVGDENDKFRLAQSRKLGSLLFQNLEQIYLLDEFDFERRGSWEPMQLQTEPYIANEHPNMEDDEPYMGMEGADHDERFDSQWDVVNVEGEIFYFGISHNEDSNLRVMKLNVDVLSWQRVTELKANRTPNMEDELPNTARCVSGELTNGFCCNGETYLVFSSVSCPDMSGRENNKPAGACDVIWRYDHGQKSLLYTGVRVPRTSPQCYSPFILPAHVLV